MQITRRLEFDAGHRIPNHSSQCKHLHGHRYALEITLSGDIVTQEGVSEQGMVMDFSDVKRIAKQQVVDVWDHAFLVYRGDTAVLEFLNSMPGHTPLCWMWYRLRKIWRRLLSGCLTMLIVTPITIT